MVRRVLASSRYFIAAAVLGAFLSSVILIVAGALAVVEIAFHKLGHPSTDVAEAKHLAVDLIQLIDVFLLGTVLYIMALGLYLLFVDPDLPLPAWLRIRDLDELKDKLVGVVIVLLGVTFLGSAVTWDGGDVILAFGAAIALVIAALALLLWVTGQSHHRDSNLPDGRAAARIRATPPPIERKGDRHRIRAHYPTNATAIARFNKVSPRGNRDRANGGAPEHVRDTPIEESDTAIT